ncbi:MAG: hypothetical protein MR902_08590 [Campylobacter sp.]|nr:hypothetical protein [Campylobacter sp.]
MRVFAVLFATILINLGLFSYPLITIFEQKYRTSLPVFVKDNKIVKFSQKLTSNKEIFKEKISLILQKANTKFNKFDENFASENSPKIDDTDKMDEILKQNISVQIPSKSEISNKTNLDNMTNSSLEICEIPSELNFDEILQGQSTKDQNTTISKNNTILLIGDSLMDGVGIQLKPHLAKFGYEVINLSKNSTGLANKEYFDWQSELENALTKHQNVAAVVVFMGANDTLDIKKTGKYISFNKEIWSEIYVSRVLELKGIVPSGVKLIWIEIPCMRSLSFDKKIKKLNAIYKNSLNAPNDYFVGTMDDFCEGGKYEAYVKIDGKSYKLRAGDGIHLTPRGYKIISDKVFEIIKDD